MPNLAQLNIRPCIRVSERYLLWQASSCIKKIREKRYFVSFSLLSRIYYFTVIPYPAKLEDLCIRVTGCITAFHIQRLAPGLLPVYRYRRSEKE